VAGLFGAFSGLSLAFLSANVFSLLLVRKLRQYSHARAAKAAANAFLQLPEVKAGHDTGPLPVPD